MVKELNGAGLQVALLDFGAKGNIAHSCRFPQCRARHFRKETAVWKEMKAFLILEDGTVFEGSHIGADRTVISEIVFNTSMAGYLEKILRYPVWSVHHLPPHIQGIILPHLRAPPDQRNITAFYLQRRDIAGMPGTACLAQG